MRGRRVLRRPDPKYFDRLLSRAALKDYPGFLKNEVPEDFKKLIIIHGLVTTDDGHDNKMLKNAFKQLGIRYKMLADYMAIDQEDWNLFKLCCNNERYVMYTGSEIGYLLLNEINTFLK